MKKSNIRVFGEISIAHVEKRGLFSYVVVRDFDKKVLAKSFSFRKYINDTIRTMYTGECYATGDYICEIAEINCSHIDFLLYCSCCIYNIYKRGFVQKKMNFYC